MSEGSITYIPDHGEQAWRRLPSRDRNGKPRLEALTRALGHGVQVVEDQLVDLIDGRGFVDATGASLDQWGGIVGEARGTLNDVDYRRFISARVLANVCKGDVEGILAVWAIVMAPWTAVRFWPHYPGYTLTAVRASFLSEDVRRRVVRLLADIRPLGAQVELVEALDGYLGFDGDALATGYGMGPISRML